MITLRQPEPQAHLRLYDLEEKIAGHLIPCKNSRLLQALRRVILLRRPPAPSPPARRARTPRSPDADRPPSPPPVCPAWPAPHASHDAPVPCPLPPAQKLPEAKMEYSLLPGVNSKTQSWRVRVRIARFWEHLDAQKNNEPVRFQFVMVDEKETPHKEVSGGDVGGRHLADDDPLVLAPHH